VREGDGGGDIDHDLVVVADRVDGLERAVGGEARVVDQHVDA